MDNEEYVQDQVVEELEEQVEETGQPAEEEPKQAEEVQEAAKEQEEVEHHKRKPGSQREREKRIAAERRLEQVERELAQMRSGNSGNHAVSSGPRLEDFNSVEEFLDFRFKQQEELRKQQELAASWDAKEKKARQEVEDFDDAFEDFVSSRPSRELVEAVMESDAGPLLAAFLGNNPDELRRIQLLSPRKQILELGKLEDRITKPKKEVKTTKAPAPITPVKSVAPTKSTNTAPRFGGMY